MKTARVSLEIEVNVTDYPDASFDKDTDNDIINLRQHGPDQKIIDTLHLDSNTTLLTSTYPYLHPTNNKIFEASQSYVSSVNIPSYIQDCSCNNTIYATIIISTVPQVFCYISRVNLHITIDRIKGDFHNILDSTIRHGTNSDHIRFHTNTIVGIISFLVIFYLKLQACTNLLLISTSFSTLSHAISSLTTVTERIHKGLNLSRRQSLT